MFQLFRTYITSVSSACFKSRSGVSDACFMCFICLQIYVASVASGCFKSRSGVASLSSLFYCLTFASVSLPPPGVGWASAAPSPSSGCWHSHLLQFVRRVRSEGGAREDSPRAVWQVQRRGPRIGRRRMQVHGGKWSAGACVWKRR
jgi:hypothetical protein